MNYYWIPFLIGLANAFSELSNQGKLKSIAGWGAWFNEMSWNNKNTWKPLGLWAYWPLVIVTDCFHSFKFIWVVLVCFLPLIQIDFNIWGEIYLNKYLSIFIIYSISFQIFYWIIPYLKLKTK